MPAPKGNQHAKGSTTNGAPKKFTKEFIERIAKDLLEWSKRPHALYLEQFIGDHEEFLNPRDFSEWARENVVFGEALSKVKKKLVGRLKCGSTIKTYDGAFVTRILPLIDEDYRKWRQEELKLEKESKTDLLTQIVDYSKALQKDA